METLSYFRFLWSVLAVAMVLAAAQMALPALRSWMRRMGPIFAAALLTLAIWEWITAGIRWLPLPYFPSPAGVFQSLINDRPLLFDSTWHSLILLLGGYALGVIAGLISGI
ncbi:MAG TPA: ABC transporter permease, partial [Chthoniobacterales bacterium]